LQDLVEELSPGSIAASLPLDEKMSLSLLAQTIDPSGAFAMYFITG